jgi:hypothetical protein
MAGRLGANTRLRGDARGGNGGVRKELAARVRTSTGVAAMISSPLFTSMPIPNGGTWTLTTYFGQMLSEAEELYGRRDLNWTPIGVEFFASTVPHIWFPGNRNHIAIRLTLSALNDLNEALWQLAHEVVHIIGPVERGKANNLEEGVATRFALNVSHYTDKSRVPLFRQKLEQTPYHSALQDCEALLQMDPDIIKKLRKQQPYLSRMTAKQLLDVLPNCDPTLAGRLTGRFPIDEVSTV